MSHTIKFWKKLIDKRIRNENNISEQIKNIKIQEKVPEKKGKLRIIKDPFKILEDAKAKERK